MAQLSFCANQHGAGCDGLSNTFYVVECLNGTHNLLAYKKVYGLKIKRTRLIFDTGYWWCQLSDSKHIDNVIRSDYIPFTVSGEYSSSHAAIFHQAFSPLQCSWQCCGKTCQVQHL